MPKAYIVNTNGDKTNKTFLLNKLCSAIPTFRSLVRHNMHSKTHRWKDIPVNTAFADLLSTNTRLRLIHPGSWISSSDKALITTKFIHKCSIYPQTHNVPTTHLNYFQMVHNKIWQPSSSKILVQHDAININSKQKMKTFFMTSPQLAPAYSSA